jgi:hypothetical protein
MVHKEAFFNFWKRAWYTKGIFGAFMCETNRLKTYRGKNILVEEAPEPSDVNWENLHVGLTNRTLREILTFLVSIVFLGICFGLIIAIKIVQINH